MGSYPQIQNLRWGIIGCGSISSMFVQDLCLELLEPSTNHIVQAIGSSSQDKAQGFASKNCPNQKPATYASYDGVYNDPDVDIVYIGTPHIFHLENALDAISKGKHVLCEKPIAMNEKDAKKMRDAARAKGVFLMEAVWTRFFPLVEKLQSLIHKERVIGQIFNVSADFSNVMPIDDGDANSRLASKALGAGALLDIGIYSLTWASIILDSAPGRKSDTAPELTASMVFHESFDPQEKIDESDVVTLRYPDLKAHAVCTSSMLFRTGKEFCKISGSGGSIIVGGYAACRPDHIILRIEGAEEKRLDFEIPGIGFRYEADAVAGDIRAGRLESEVCPINTTLTIMSRMDAARAQCGLTYPQDS